MESCGIAIVIAEHSPESRPTPHSANLRKLTEVGCDDLVVEPLMVSLSVIVLHFV